MQGTSRRSRNTGCVEHGFWHKTKNARAAAVHPRDGTAKGGGVSQPMVGWNVRLQKALRNAHRRRRSRHCTSRSPRAADHVRHGRLVTIPGTRRHQAGGHERVLREMTQDPAKIQESRTTRGHFSYGSSLARFRVNAFDSAASVTSAAAIRSASRRLRSQPSAGHPTGLARRRRIPPRGPGRPDGQVHDARAMTTT